MIYKFSDSAKRALENADSLAKKMGKSYVGTEHLLYGLSSEESGIAYKILKNQKIDKNKILEKIYETYEKSKNNISRIQGFTPKTRKVIEEAYIQTEKIYLKNIGTEQLLLGILNEKENMATSILLDLDLDIKLAYKDIYKVLEQEEYLNKTRKNDSGTRGNSQANNALKQYATDLTKLAYEGKVDSVIGRNEQIDRVIQILSRRNKNNPCLIGEPGVGKTAIVEGLARKIIERNVPENMQEKRIYSLDLASLVAGAKYRGDFEDRIKKCITEIKKSKDIILFIDEIHNIVGAGAAEGAIDAANILKPILARGEIQLIGATTIEEYRKYIEKDAALERRFSPIMIEEPSMAQTIEILKGLKEKYEKHHNIIISNKAIEECVNLSQRYITDRFMPDKAIDLLDEASSKAKMKTYMLPKSIKKVEEKVNEIEKEKNEAIAMQDFEKAAQLRDNEITQRNALEKEKERWREEKLNDKIILNANDIREVVSNLTKIPLTKITQTENSKLNNLQNELKRKIIGQDYAIESVTNAIKRGRIGINDPNKPICSFLFLGSTGVGKTKLSRVLAKSLFGSENNIIKLDMSEYMEAHSVSKIIGSPPGYIGYEEGGQLTKKIRSNPYSIILIDEIEKAHHDVINVLLQILDEGSLTDASGRKVNFRNTIIIMTSNVGSEFITENKKIGFTSKNSETLDKNKEVYNALKKEFRPEFLNRIDEVIIFNKLNKDDLIKIISIELENLQSRLSKRRITLNVNEDVKEYICENEIDSNYGAREVKRKLQRLIENVIAENMINEELKNNQMISFELINNKIRAQIQ